MIFVVCYMRNVQKLDFNDYGSDNNQVFDVSPLFLQKKTSKTNSFQLGPKHSSCMIVMNRLKNEIKKSNE